MDAPIELYNFILPISMTFTDLHGHSNVKIENNSCISWRHSDLIGVQTLHSCCNLYIYIYIYIYICRQEN